MRASVTAHVSNQLSWDRVAAFGPYSFDELLRLQPEGGVAACSRCDP